MQKIINIDTEATEKTPGIDFDQFTGNLVLSGKSIPENAAKVYEPLLNWVQEYIKNARPVTNLRLNLEYFNTASILWISKIIKLLCGIEGADNVLFIHLYVSIEDFESFDDIQEDIITLTNNTIKCSALSVGFKVYGTDDNGKIIKDARVFI